MPLKNIVRISIPIPIPALKTVNSYLITDKEDLLIIDTGMPIRASLGYLEEKLIESGFKIKDIRKIIITHLHIDHIGGAGYLQKVSGAPVSIHEKEAGFISRLVNYPEESVKAFRIMMYKSGVPKNMIDRMMFFHPGISNQAVYSKINYNANVRDNDIITVGDRELRVIGTPGHSIHNICIYDDENEILFSGDHILPKITPNIRMPLGEDNPLGEYLRSLEKVSKLKVKYYLPGHGDINSNLQERIKTLKCHHYQRLLETFRIISDKPLSAYEISSKMKWDIEMPWEDFPTIQKYFAIGEALAHIRYLQENNVIEKIYESGVEKFRVLPVENKIDLILREKVCD